MDPWLVKRSRCLSKVLRHDPASVGITLTEAGWAPVTEILRVLNLKQEELDQIIAENNKSRFEYSENGHHIRARQGHSIDVNLGYSATTPPNLLYHGTSKRNLPIILVEGLKKMQRHHVHMSPDVATAEIVAKRRPAPRVLVVNFWAMTLDGIKFYLTGNGVWLTDYVDPRYLREYTP